jgi:hypothetical protein
MINHNNPPSKGQDKNNNFRVFSQLELDLFTILYFKEFDEFATRFQFNASPGTIANLFNPLFETEYQNLLKVGGRTNGN